MLKPKKLLIIVSCAGALMVLALVVLWQFLPGFLETRILPGLAMQNGIGWQKGRIRHIGLTGFEAGPVIVGRDNTSGITVDSVYVDYTPWGLFQKRINRMIVSGLNLHVSVNNGGIAISGIDTVKPPPSSQKVPDREPAESSVAVERLRINHAVLNLDWENGHLRIPFDLTARLAPTGEIDAMLALYPCGQKMLVSGRWSQKDASGHVSLAAHSLSVEKMVALLKAVPGLVLGGNVDLQAGASIQMSPFKFSDLSMSLSSASLSAVYGDLKVAAVQDANNISTPFHLQLLQTGPKHFTLKGGNLMVRSRAPLVVDDLEGDFIYDPQVIHAALQVKSRLPAFTEASGLPFTLQKDLKLVTGISAQYALNKGWQFDVADIPGGTSLEASAGLVAGGVQVVAAKPVYMLNLNGQGTAVKGTFSMASTGIRVDSPSGSVDALKLAVQGDIETGASGSSSLPRGSAVLQMSGIKAEIGESGSEGSVSIAIPEIQARVEMEVRDGSKPMFKGDVRLAASDLNALAGQVKLSGIEARVPWQWPARDAGAKGLVAIGHIQWQNQDVGSLDMTVQQQSHGVSLQGEHISTLLPALEFGFSGEVEFPTPQGIAVHGEASLSRPASAPEIDLGRFSKGARGIFFKGPMNGEFKGSYRAGGMGGTACVRMENIALRMPEKDVAVKNLSLGLCFPDLPQLTTGSSQTLTFDAATAGNFKTENGFFHFQLEPYQTLFVEKGRVGWCKGQIRLQPMRITPGVDEYETRLDCDRLNLAQILEQLSVADAKGEGTVNGTLPISIKKGRIRFNDGFLYSTPGDGGKISLSGADALMAGIPKGTRQFFQVDLAREALKDFDYKWAKLRLVSEEENLRMRLQFDGKPGRILPFEYDQDIGGFVRVGADSGGSDFQGISLDVNFLVPLNDLLEYKGLLEIFE